MKLRQLFIGIVGLVLFSVASAAVKSDQVENTLPNGIWQTKGYAYVLNIVDNSIAFYDITQKHCLINQYLTRVWTRKKDAGKYIKRLSASSAEIDMGSAHPIKLDKLEKLPELCSQALLKTSYDRGYQFDALQVFDVFWHTYAEMYPFDSAINWDDAGHYTTWRNQLSQQSTEGDLLNVLTNILKTVNDGHYTLADENYTDLVDFNPRSFEFEARIERTQKGGPQPEKFWHVYWELVARLEDNIDKYIDKTQRGRGFYDNFFYKPLEGNLGYFSIKSMDEFSEKETIAADLEAATATMEELISDFASHNGLVIDLRFNEGGTDLVALKLLSYFVDKPTVVASKQRKSFAKLGQKQAIKVTPAANKTYTGPVVVLTSELTASAAEVFILGLKARGNATFIGEPTNGSYSDILEKQLPNGWILGLSHEIYRDINDISYEFAGFPVSKKVEFLDLKDIEKGSDRSIEEAIVILKSITSASNSH